MKKLGRPVMPKGTAHTTMVAFRVSKEELAMIRNAARDVGSKMTVFIRRAVLDRAAEYADALPFSTNAAP